LADYRKDASRVGVLSVQPSSVVGTVAERTADFKASSSIGGSALPRFSARRRIPEHAFWLKKNRSGTVEASTSTCDNEDTLPSLRDGTSVAVHSYVLSVQDPVGPPIPEVFQPPEEGSKRPSSVLRQDTGDVFPHDPARLRCADQSEKLQREATARVGQSLPESSDREGLAGSPSDEEVDGIASVNRVSWLDELGEVAMILDLRVVVREDCAREWVDLTEPRRLPAKRVPCDRSRLDA
jgi:hypothetical protein